MTDRILETKYIVCRNIAQVYIFQCNLIFPEGGGGGGEKQVHLEESPRRIYYIKLQNR